jgi:hypothetical protein
MTYDEEMKIAESIVKGGVEHGWITPGLPQQLREAAVFITLYWFFQDLGKAFSGGGRLCSKQDEKKLNVEQVEVLKRFWGALKTESDNVTRISLSTSNDDFSFDEAFFAVGDLFSPHLAGPPHPESSPIGKAWAMYAEVAALLQDMKAQANAGL